MFISIITHTTSLILPILGFMIFSIMNKSIVLGDKNNHKMTIHLGMILHFFVITFLLLFPYLACKYSLKILRKEIKLEIFKIRHFLGILVCSFILLYSCHAHPFLLADNR